MKKYIDTSFFYFILAMVAGVFYREFTKFSGFTGRTVLGFAHGHLLALGTIVFLIVALFYSRLNLKDNKKFGAFFKVYNFGVLLTAIMMVARGVTQVKGTVLSTGNSAMISGIAGIGHIAVFIGLLLFFLALREEASKSV